MKPSRMPWLAIALFMGLNAAAQAQQENEKPGNSQEQGNPAQTPGQNKSGNLQSAVKGLDTQSIRLVEQAVSANWLANNFTVWNLSDQTAEMSLTPADDALRAHLGLPKDQGLIVTGLSANASAAHAGVQQNDVLLKLADAPLAKPDDLEAGLKGAGNKPAVLTILRGGKKVTFQVQPKVRVTMGPVQPEPPAFWIGISVSPLEPALRSQLRLSHNHGLLATEIFKDSPAAKAGVKVHDILVSLADKPLDSQQKLIDLVQANGDKTIPLELIREGKPQTIDVTPLHRQAGQLRVNVQLTHPDSWSYRLVRPGAVVSNPSLIVDSNNTLTLQAPDPALKQPQDAPAAVSRRLDDVDSEIKQLRNAIEELSKTLKDKK
jgi:serine protease Do